MRGRVQADEQAVRGFATKLRGALCLSLLVLTAFLTEAQQNQNTSERASRKQTRATKPTPTEIELVRQSAHPLTGDARDYDPLIELIGEARFVLLGEATHGTHEFYRERARITRRLVEEKGFNLVVLEADWPDAFRVGEYVRGRGADASAEESLSNFRRFPRWMWRNADFRDFVNWLRTYNDSRRAEAAEVGVYGMDLYSVSDSADAVVSYLKRVDAEAGRRARKRYGCLSGYRDRPEQYGYDVATGMHRSCEKETTAQLRELEERIASWQADPNRVRDDELFDAFQNARVVRHGEAYYRLIYRQNFSTWNLRDRHMTSTIQELVKYTDKLGGRRAKVVVWAHNSHQGDARMTVRGEAGELNVGHLMRQYYDGQTVLVGFTTYAGELRAASEWGQQGSRLKLRPALEESYAGLFHQTGIPDFLLLFRGNEKLSEALGSHRLQRAVGVVYMPGTERRSHYFDARLSKQFDAVIHLDTTSAVQPLN
jgi:erythromycin esterase-like protein